MLGGGAGARLLEALSRSKLHFPWSAGAAEQLDADSASAKNPLQCG